MVLPNLQIQDMIRLYTTKHVEGIESIQFKEFQDWVEQCTEIQFDIETTVTPYWCTKQLLIMAFGSIDGSTQYIIDYTSLNEVQVNVIKEVLESWTILKIGHRLSFEYVVCKFHGIELHNVYCTLVAEKLIWGGEETVDYSLNDLIVRYFNRSLDKSLQTSFTEDSLTFDQIQYAATDVMYLQQIREYQSTKLTSPNVVWLEMKCLLAFSECTYNGFTLKVDKWKENINLVEPIIQEAKDNLEKFLISDERMYKRALENNYVSKEPRVLINYNSPKQKKFLYSLLFPGITGSSLLILSKYIQDNPNISQQLQFIALDLMEGNYESLTNELLTNHQDVLISNGLLLPANQITINWSSKPQCLSLFQAVAPKLTSLNKESLSNQTHKIFSYYKEYTDSLKLKSTYGQSFIDKYLEPDGKIRTNYNPIVSTGRSSSASPNMQNIPAKKSVGNRYRNCFYTPGRLIVDSDYTGQELCLIAFGSQDPVWLECLRTGQDLHSVTAAMVFEKDWKAGSEVGCKFVENKQKCNCKVHEILRTRVKSINFGLAYGMSKFKLSADLDISVKEAENMIETYFNTFPRIRTFLFGLAKYALLHGYSQSFPPFLRRRYYPNIDQYDQATIDAHLSGIVFKPGLGRIERQAKNQPIQGAGSDLIKLAMWLVYKYIRAHNLQDKVSILLNVHDQLTTDAEPDFAEEWAIKLDALMCEAALQVIPSGLLKAETKITEQWNK